MQEISLAIKPHVHQLPTSPHHLSGSVILREVGQKWGGGLGPVIRNRTAGTKNGGWRSMSISGLDFARGCQ